MHSTDMYLQDSSIIWAVWLNVSVFVYKLSGCGFESRCVNRVLSLNVVSNCKRSNVIFSK